VEFGCSRCKRIVDRDGVIICCGTMATEGNWIILCPNCAAKEGYHR